MRDTIVSLNFNNEAHSGPMAADYEKLGLFYLGKRYDLASNARLDDLILYDSRDLLTHAVVLGMTGSGKTGLGITLLEEAAIDGVPVLAIDPKGDLTNLLLTFPDLAPSDFAPWVDEGEASRKQMTVDAYAADIAKRWKAGLAEWDQDGSRIARLRAAAEVRVYTPGSRAAHPARDSWADRQSRHETAEDAQAGSRRPRRGCLVSSASTDVQPHSRELALVSTILQTRQGDGDTDLRVARPADSTSVLRSRRRPRPRNVLPGARSPGARAEIQQRPRRTRLRALERR